MANVQYTPFSCRDAIRHLCKRSNKSEKKVTRALTDFANETLLSLFKYHYYALFELVKLCQISLCIIGKKCNANHRNVYGCLLDTRYLVNVFPPSKPVYWIIDMDTGVLLKETTKRKKIPELQMYREKLLGLKASLWDILQIPGMENVSEPQSASDLKKVLQKNNLLSTTNVLFCISIVPQQEMPWVIGHQDSATAPLCFFAYTLADLSVGYAFRQPKKITPHSMSMNFDIEEETHQNVPDPSTLNRRLSVNIKMSGLLLAYKLGACQLEEIQQLSMALAQCVGALWVTFDEERHIRHAVYKDFFSKHSAEIKCQGDSEKEWTRFFKQIQMSAKVMKKEKEHLLAPLVLKLMPFGFPAIKSPWSQCLQQLRLVISKHKVFVFCHDDTVLHHIKAPIAGVFHTLHSKGVSITTLANYTITSIGTSSVVFINLAEYFNYSGKVFQPYLDDDVLWQVAQDWLSHDGDDSLTAWSHPELKHSTALLKHHPKMFGQSCITYTLQRALRNAHIIIKLWCALTHHTLEQFSYDLASLSHQSLSKISYDIIWLSYAEQAGPLAHSLENLHPFTVYKLRPWCKGGFSYSFQNYLKMGQALSPGKEGAKSIRELDLCSAYGFSGMTMKSAKGFGIAFGDNIQTQKRHKSFEYKATMYTIFKLSVLEGKCIKAVFSNYSPLGLVYIGKHALDLVVVTTDNHVMLYQFDGHFCHGDYNHPNCPSLENYANKTSRLECEQKTQARDETILNWLMKTSIAQSSYQVLTDCCHPEYSKKSLDRAFQHFNPLHELISGLDGLDGSIKSADLSKVTFLAIVEGHTTLGPQEQLAEFGPIFVTEDETSTTHHQHSVHGGKLLLTRDYYIYLRDTFGFQISHIEWIIFYKICTDLPMVFQKLVTLRNQAGKKSSKDAFYKTINNYACGYFGLNSSKHARMVARIAYKLPKHFNIFRDDVTPLPSFGHQNLLLVQSFFKNKRTQYECKTPLVLFVQIIEFGKQTLNRAVQTLQKHIRPTAMQILYSNVDNLILALAGDSLADVLKLPSLEGQQQFFREWSPLSGNLPGQLKEEWCHTSSELWRFVSPCRMFHVLLTQEDKESHHKSALFTGLPTEEAFKVAMSVLKKQHIQIEQEKKRAKLVGTDTHKVIYNYNSSK